MKTFRICPYCFEEITSLNGQREILQQCEYDIATEEYEFLDENSDWDNEWTLHCPDCDREVEPEDNIPELYDPESWDEYLSLAKKGIKMVNLDFKEYAIVVSVKGKKTDDPRIVLELEKGGTLVLAEKNIVKLGWYFIK